MKAAVVEGVEGLGRAPDMFAADKDLRDGRLTGDLAQGDTFSASDL